ncbi:hypothetical protein CKAN_01208700 [Cinnamomum micranthum f. kanehirae]|uniref:Uncharacterized protein n=1 Tax=Cinnamomum micranthum f. kanehirae TaxID=337451 RepID=A0A3S3MGQ1_9MAGN|nr:hypothetical protein CKAN_01208700 [Cinnamomum micranthum f. kanehirae]
MDMSGTGRTGNDELHDSRWLGAILPIILGYLQLIPQQQRRQGEGGGEGNAAAAAARCDSLIASSLSFTIALIALTASIPLPPSKGLKICIFHLMLGCVIPLSSALPNVVCWLPFLSCIRPLFDLLPPRLQLRILHFSEILCDAIKCYVAFLFHMLPDPFQTQILQIFESSWNVIVELVTVDASRDAQSSPPAPAQVNINLDMVESLHDGITNIASTSLEGVHEHPLEDLNSL